MEVQRVMAVCDSLVKKMGEGDELDDPQICRGPMWDAPLLNNQAVTNMDGCHLLSNSRVNGRVVEGGNDEHVLISETDGSNGVVTSNGFTYVEGIVNGTVPLKRSKREKTNGVIRASEKPSEFLNGEVHIPDATTNGSVSNGHANGSVSTGKISNGSIPNGRANGAILNGKANGCISNGKTNENMLTGKANGAILNSKVNGTTSNGKAYGSILNGKANGSLLNGTSNGHLPNDGWTSEAKTNVSARDELNGAVAPEIPDDVIKNGLVDVYKDGIVEGLEVPHGDVRKTIRANMLGVQPNFKHYTWEIKWGHVFMIGFVHVWALLAIPSIFHIKWQTFLLRMLEGGIAGVGVTAGAHRLYTHKSYKATLPLHLFLLWAYSVAGQNTLFDWVRDHRVHHKFSETDADPHNANRGWFFSHCGWLMVRKHPEVLRRGKTVDMSDITDDPYIAIHSKIFYVLKTVTCHVIPTLIPMMLWDEGFWVSANTMIFRFAFTLNATWSVNSFAHLWGDRPIDKRIFPGENALVAFVTFGEGWHNYHHVFPWDYKAAEWGPGIFNMATIFLDVCSWLGLAYDLKQPSPDLIRRTALKHGDGTWTNTHVLEEMPEPSVSKDHAKAC